MEKLIKKLKDKEHRGMKTKAKDLGRAMIGKYKPTKEIEEMCRRLHGVGQAAILRVHVSVQMVPAKPECLG